MGRPDRLKAALDLTTSVAVLLAAGAVIWTFLVRPALSTGTARTQVEDLQNIQIDVSSIRHVLGDGVLAIVEFSDFQCPFCARYATETLPVVKQDILESLPVRYVAFHFPLENIHPLALLASKSAECAGQQGQFWSMHERLFKNSSALDQQYILDHEGELKLDPDRFAECLEAEETLAKIRSDQAEGRRLGVRGTPALFIGRMRPDGGIDLHRRINGVASADLISEQIASLLATGS